MQITNELLGKKIKICFNEETIIAIDSDESSTMRVAVTHRIKEAYPISKSQFIDTMTILNGFENELYWRWVSTEELQYMIRYYGDLR